MQGLNISKFIQEAAKTIKYIFKCCVLHIFSILAFVITGTEACRFLGISDYQYKGEHERVMIKKNCHLMSQNFI